MTSTGVITQHFCLLVSLQLIIFLSHPLISLIGRLGEDKGLHSNKGPLSRFYCFLVFILTSPYFREIFLGGVRVSSTKGHARTVAPCVDPIKTEFSFHSWGGEQ